MRRTWIAWLVLIGLTAGSLGLALTRTQPMPTLPITLGPDLTVREVKVSGPVGARSQFERGDRLVAMQGRSLEDLRDLRATMESLDFEKAVTPSEPEAASLASQPTLEVSYQIVRPLHRFNLLLQGEPLDPTALPPGVELTDKLVELDGRPMQPEVPTEGLRSIISSRPEALLVFERKNAVFNGRIAMPPPAPRTALALVFGAALLILLALWRFRHHSLSGWTPLAVGLETIAFGWLALVIFEYQWVLSDYALASMTLGCLIMTRPLGIFARAATAEGIQARSWGIVALGVAGALGVILMMTQGTLENAEVALQLATLIASLFVVFEVVLTGLNEESGQLLGERSIYLAGIILFVLCACVVSWSMDELAFKEERWRWFAALVLALVWFGDVLLCLRGLPPTPFAEIEDAPRRQEVLLAYLAELEAHYDGLTPALMMHWPDRSLIARARGEELVLEEADAELHDGIAIMVQEGGRIPAPAHADPTVDLVAGLAHALKLALALRLAPPHQSVRAEECHLVLLAWYRDATDAPGEAPALAQPLQEAELDHLQQRLSPVVWTAGLVEALIFAARVAKEQRAVMTSAPAPSPSPPAAPQLNSGERAALEAELGQARRWVRTAGPAPALQTPPEQTLEPALCDALAYLFESPEAVVIAGPAGSGKLFVASAAHQLDAGRAGASCLCYDARRARDAATHHDDLIGAHDAGGLLAACSGGSLIILNAQLLAHDTLEAALDEAQAAQVRLYLCVEDEHAHARSALDTMPAPLQARLGAREVVIPDLAARAGARDAIIDAMWKQLTERYERPDLALTEEAIDHLHALPYHGQLDELRMMLDVAIRSAPHEARAIALIEPVAIAWHGQGEA